MNRSQYNRSLYILSAPQMQGQAFIEVQFRVLPAPGKGGTARDVNRHPSIACDFDTALGRDPESVPQPEENSDRYKTVMWLHSRLNGRSGLRAPAAFPCQLIQRARNGAPLVIVKLPFLLAIP